MNDVEILKRHGYVFSLSDSNSSDSDDPFGTYKTPLYVGGSAHSSDLSDFDGDYSAEQPPPIRISDYQHLIVKIKATNDISDEKSDDESVSSSNASVNNKNPWKNLTSSNLKSFGPSLVDFPPLPRHDRLQPKNGTEVVANNCSEMLENCFSKKLSVEEQPSNVLEIRKNCNREKGTVTNAAHNEHNLVKTNKINSSRENISQKYPSHEMVLQTNVDLNMEVSNTIEKLHKYNSSNSNKEQLKLCKSEDKKIDSVEFPSFSRQDTQEINSKNTSPKCWDENILNCLKAEKWDKSKVTPKPKTKHLVQIRADHKTLNSEQNCVRKKQICAKEKLTQKVRGCDVPRKLNINVEKPKIDDQVLKSSDTTRLEDISSKLGRSNLKYTRENLDDTKQPVSNKYTKNKQKHEDTKNFKASGCKLTLNTAKEVYETKHKISSYRNNEATGLLNANLSRSLPSSNHDNNNILVSNGVESNFKKYQLVRDNKAVLTRKRIAAGRRSKRDVQTIFTVDTELLVSAIFLLITLVVIYSLCTSFL